MKEQLDKPMQSLLERLKARYEESIKREQKLQHPIEAFARLLWPYSESKLIFYVVVMAIMDFVSTFIALALSGNDQIGEAGLLARWALRTGGFPRLLLADIVLIGTLVCLAICSRAFYKRAGFAGFGKAAFIFLLVPYLVVIMGVVINNTLLTFL
jgi:hypothetical protein